jgi:sporulation protein YlmC with PRC-barrel domain
MRVSDLIGRQAYDRTGRPLGRITELLTTPTEQGYVVRAALVTPGHEGRLMGYSRPEFEGPWLIQRIVERLHRGTHEVAWEDIRLDPGA